MKSNDEERLNAVKTILNIEDKADFWEEISEEDQVAIDQALEQLDRGNFISRDSLHAEIKEKYNF
ncbi:hypothetical protein OU792_12555 [Algoriphagus sp. NF]|uniref:hypothetical protein n=1 Tax=Algoriphagus sp. NF TaxID=2992756 RepID=UPI00237A657C|nr:hypothetical protein [Algoriphagus sp. NF]MDE0560821.1 hypothetical protein [Algoriphagus sp. NF]